jgi:hypothetical protein
MIIIYSLFLQMVSPAMTSVAHSMVDDLQSLVMLRHERITKTTTRFLVNKAVQWQLLFCVSVWSVGVLQV